MGAILNLKSILAVKINVQSLSADFRATSAKIGTFRMGVSAMKPPKHLFKATAAYGDHKKRFLWFKLRIAVFTVWMIVSALNRAILTTS